jgi:hypothetical protein
MSTLTIAAVVLGAMLLWTTERWLFWFGALAAILWLCFK